MSLLITFKEGWNSAFALQDESSSLFSIYGRFYSRHLILKHHFIVQLLINVDKLIENRLSVVTSINTFGKH